MTGPVDEDEEFDVFTGEPVIEEGDIVPVTVTLITEVIVLVKVTSVDAVESISVHVVVELIAVEFVDAVVMDDQGAEVVFDDAVIVESVVDELGGAVPVHEVLVEFVIDVETVEPVALLV